MFTTFHANSGNHGGRFAGPRPYSVENLVPAQTGPLEMLTGRNVLALMDVNNLVCGARRTGHKPSFQSLADLLRRTTSGAALHAFYATDADDTKWGSYFSSHGYVPHHKPVEIVTTCKGVERKANADNLLLLAAGHLLANRQYNVLLIGSGDGDLVADLARFSAQLSTPLPVVTLSFPLSTSWRLLADSHPNIAANAFFGRDCLHPLLHEHWDTSQSTKAGVGFGLGNDYR